VASKPSCSIPQFRAGTAARIKLKQPDRADFPRPTCPNRANARQRPREYPEFNGRFTGFGRKFRLLTCVRAAAAQAREAG
jgi:hypothetical protein